MSYIFNYPKIKSVKILDNHRLEILFSNNITKIINFENKLREPTYEDLENKYLFNQVVIDVGGCGLSWNDDIDISEYELWNMQEEDFEKWKKNY